MATQGLSLDLVEINDQTDTQDNDDKRWGILVSLNPDYNDADLIGQDNCLPFITIK